MPPAPSSRSAEGVKQSFLRVPPRANLAGSKLVSYHNNTRLPKRGRNGRLTQWLECVLHTDEVTGSNPVSPTLHKTFLLKRLRLPPGGPVCGPNAWDSAEVFRKTLGAALWPAPQPSPFLPPAQAIWSGHRHREPEREPQGHPVGEVRHTRKQVGVRAASSLNSAPHLAPSRWPPATAFPRGVRTSPSAKFPRPTGAGQKTTTSPPTAKPVPAEQARSTHSEKSVRCTVQHRRSSSARKHQGSP